jgi:hypothetical protein
LSLSSSSTSLSLYFHCSFLRLLHLFLCIFFVPFFVFYISFFVRNPLN